MQTMLMLEHNVDVRTPRSLVTENIQDGEWVPPTLFMIKARDPKDRQKIPRRTGGRGGQRTYTPLGVSALVPTASVQFTLVSPLYKHCLYKDPELHAQAMP
jgi:hypothetical protein